MAKSGKTKAKGQTAKPALPKSLRKGGLPRPVGDVFAAGIGALERAQKKGAEGFDTLVSRGERVAQDGSDAVRAAIRDVEAAADRVTGRTRSTVEGAANAVTAPVERAVEAALAALGVPTRAEVVALREQVDALQARLADLRAGGATSSSVSSTSEEARPEAEAAVYRVGPHPNGWAVRKGDAERALSVHATKQEAVKAGRERARGQAPSRLVVLRADGTEASATDYGA